MPDYDALSSHRHDEDNLSLGVGYQYILQMLLVQIIN